MSNSLSPLFSTVHGILQTRVLVWAAIPFSRGSSQTRNRTQVSCMDSLPAELLGKFLLYESESHSVMFTSLQPHGLYSPWNSPGQNTELGSLSLLQGIFPTQGLNPDPPHHIRILYQLSRKGSPRILEWVAYPFSSGSSQPRNPTGVSCIVGRFFTN